MVVAIIYPFRAASFSSASSQQEARRFNPNPCSIEEKNLQNLPRSQSNNAMILTRRTEDVKLPPIDHGRLASIAPQKQKNQLLLPRLHSLISVEEQPKTFNLFDSLEGSPCHSVTSEGSIPPLHCQLAISDDGPNHARLADWNVDSRSVSPRSWCSITGHSVAQKKGQSLSLMEEVMKIQLSCDQISKSRPQYTTDPSNDEPKRHTQRGPTVKGERNETITKTIDDERKERHAHKERERRERHKVSITKLYQRVSDWVLEQAGWQPGSTKAPTKDVILYATNLFLDMRDEKDELLFQAIKDLQQENVSLRECSALKDWTIQGLRQQLQMPEERYENADALLRAKARQEIIDRRCTFCTQNSLTHEATEQGRSDQNTIEKWTGPNSSPTKRFSRSTSPHQHLQTLSDSFHNPDSGLAKRKREEDEDETAPAGPLRYATAHQSLDNSPRSPTSSRGSWCLVEKQA